MVEVNLNSFTNKLDAAIPALDIGLSNSKCRTRLFSQLEKLISKKVNETERVEYKVKSSLQARIISVKYNHGLREEKLSDSKAEANWTRVISGKNQFYNKGHSMSNHPANN